VSFRPEGTFRRGVQASIEHLGQSGLRPQVDSCEIQDRFREGCVNPCLYTLRTIWICCVKGTWCRGPERNSSCKANSSSIPVCGILPSLPSIWFPSNSDGNQIGNFATLCEDRAAATLTALPLKYPRQKSASLLTIYSSTRARSSSRSLPTNTTGARSRPNASRSTRTPVNAATSRPSIV
jgi:hypothetical protein